MVAAWSLVLQGCYESLPLRQGTAPTAVRVEFVLNDQGRAALSDKLGPAVQKIEGEVVDQNDGSYVLSVYRVTSFDGNSAAWTGERVNVAKEQTSGYQVRRLSRTRTTLLAAGVLAGVTLVFFGKSLGIGGGSETVPGPPPPIPVR